MENMRQTSDQRWSTRTPLSLNVKLFNGGEQMLQTKTHNIGIGGMFIEGNAQRLQRDAHLSVAFTVAMDGNATHHRLPATVIWSGENGAGLMFTDFNVETVHTLREILYAPKT